VTIAPGNVFIFCLAARQSGPNIVIWNQTHFLFDRGLAFSVVLAFSPILTLLFLLGGLRKRAWIACLSDLIVTLIVSDRSLLDATAYSNQRGGKWSRTWSLPDLMDRSSGPRY
jgi:hypothetical protein